MTETPEWFRPTSGRVLGTLALVAAALVVVAAVADREGYSVPLALGAIIAGVLAWSSMLRPGVAVTSTTLILRNMLETVHIPLAAIEEIAVRQVLAVRAGERRYVSPAIGKSWRKAARSRGSSTDRLTPEQALARSYPDFVEARIRQLSDDARSQLGVRRGSPEQAALADGVRRDPAWLEIGLLSVFGVGFLLALLL